MTINPDGKMIASGDSSGTVTLWNVTTGVGQPLTGHMDKVDIAIVRFSPDGKILAARGRDGTLFLWDTAELKRLNSPPITLSSSIAGSTGMAFSPDEDILALASGTSIYLWNLKTQELVAHSLTSSYVEDLIFGLHGQLLSTTNIGHGVPILAFTL
jgi:WD40 repeat protein